MEILSTRDTAASLVDNKQQISKLAHRNRILTAAIHSFSLSSSWKRMEAATEDSDNLQTELDGDM